MPHHAADRIDTTRFRWYLAGLGSWYASVGIGLILFPWLVAVVLHESPQRVGLAQMASMGPAILFMLLLLRAGLWRQEMPNAAARAALPAG